MKLHEIPGVIGSDYINANFLDVSVLLYMYVTSMHWHLQAWAYIAQDISNHVYSYHKDRMRRHMVNQHIAYVCTDIHIVYSVVTKYAFRNCASNAA